MPLSTRNAAPFVERRPETMTLIWRNSAELKIQSYWINYYCGGKQPANHDHHIYLDNLAIATGKRLGPATGKQ